MSPSDPAPRPRRDPLPHDQRRARRPQADAPLLRSRDDRLVAGVAGGIAAFSGAPSRTVRALWLLTVPLSIGITALGYLLLWALIPEEPRPA